MARLLHEAWPHRLRPGRVGIHDPATFTNTTCVEVTLTISGPQAAKLYFGLGHFLCRSPAHQGQGVSARFITHTALRRFLVGKRNAGSFSR